MSTMIEYFTRVYGSILLSKTKSENKIIYQIDTEPDRIQN